MKKSALVAGAIVLLSASSNALLADTSVDPQSGALSAAANRAAEPDLVYFRSGPHISKYVLASTKPETDSFELV